MIYGPTTIQSNPNTPWCTVHTYENYSSIPQQWGYVNEDCKGQVPDKSRPEHLAAPGYESFWKTRIFYIEPYLPGYCHTYTPNETHVYGKEGHLYAFLDGVKKTSSYDFRGYYIYIHSNQVFKKL